MNDNLPRTVTYDEAIRSILGESGLTGLTAKSRRPIEAYDDQQAVDWYVTKYWTQYLNESEKRCYQYGMRLSKAEHEPETPWGREVLAEWKGSADQELRAALAGGFTSFQERLWQMALARFQTGTLVVNRCPRCKRVVRTPGAGQCLWCGYDWHGSV